MTQDIDKIALLQNYFTNNDILLCNESKDTPSLGTVGGDWNSIVFLIEQGEVFYSKHYKNRVTYLSREYYSKIKPKNQHIDKLSQKSQEVLEYIKAAGLASTKDIKAALLLTEKEYNTSMNQLLKELLITAIKRDRIISDTWCTFYWGTTERWESRIDYI